jgi:hypothetical protein
MKPLEYAPTAYDSTRPRDLPPLDESRLGRLDKAVRRWPLKGKGVQCREFLANSHAPDAVELLREMGEEGMNRLRESEMEKGASLTIEWGSLRNPAMIVNAIGKVAIFFAFGGVVASLILLLTLGFDYSVLKLFLMFVPVQVGIYYLCKLAVDRGWVKSRHNTRFERLTGMVEFTLKGRRKRLPFDEFDPYVSEGVGPNGIARYYLRLVHRYSDVLVTNPYSRYEPWELERDWEELQRVMDISKPLPDIPRWELARKADPTTRDYDRRVGRPALFWLHQDPEEVQSWADASREALKRYPWGLPRGEALRSGWTPSGYGEGEAIWKRWPRKGKQERQRPVRAVTA